MHFVHGGTAAFSSALKARPSAHLQGDIASSDQHALASTSPVREPHVRRSVRIDPGRSISRTPAATFRGVRSLCAVVVISVAVVGCASDIEPYAVSNLDDDLIFLSVSCAHDLRADLTETRDEVRIENLRGRVENGDCLSVVSIPLETPLGDRTIVVNGDAWVELSATCGYGTLGSPDLDFEGCEPITSP